LKKTNKFLLVESTAARKMVNIAPPARIRSLSISVFLFDAENFVLGCGFGLRID
jgi:hypothetical protein